MRDMIPIERVENKIYLIRGTKVMLDFDLAILYGVETKYLKRQVRRNKERFPNDFIFTLNKEEYGALRRQIGTLEKGQHSKYLPYAFTEQGVAMLSSVLRSKRAIHVNIQIMRTFAKLRRILSTHKELKDKIEAMERRYDQQFKVVFEAIKKLIDAPIKKTGKIGFLKKK